MVFSHSQMFSTPRPTSLVERNRDDGSLLLSVVPSFGFGFVVQAPSPVARQAVYWPPCHGMISTLTLHSHRRSRYGQSRLNFFSSCLAVVPSRLHGMNPNRLFYVHKPRTLPKKQGFHFREEPSITNDTHGGDALGREAVWKNQYNRDFGRSPIPAPARVFASILHPGLWARG